MKRKVMFIFGFLLLVLLITFLVTFTSQTLANKVTSFYSDIQKKQERAFLGNFNEGRGKVDLDITKLEIEEIDLPKNNNGEIMKGETLDKKEREPWTEGKPKKKNSYLIYSLIAIPLILLFILRKRRKRKKLTINILDVNELKGVDEIQGGGIDINVSLSKEKQNEIRRLLQEWQGKLRDDQKKKTNETIHEWFGRIGGPSEIIPIYEKVRYGYQNFTKVEYDLVYSRLR
ncbi:hypothetical protein FZC78_06410 [Rossellomorea vietnamensis]|uniref:Uncharacterized protein n=1 Tax=Rossellomorea vietnamensis TaxID=218284 RepID=A0A5D4NVZ8_9BACI|nr:hypothetical protein [Rossellomorea vietnamensis]TYS17506.1 hypothetical protein FZC78_06410 [Rossellomorea vietnamensis]